MTPILKVSEISYFIKNMFDSNDVMQKLYVRGEISNFKHHISGHMYFSLKDEKSRIKCVMFKRNNILLPFVPENGMSIIAFGYISVYVKNGEYQLYVEDMEPDGIGALHIAFEKLKEQLRTEGLFDESRKKPIPFLPKTIGIATSSTGAAIRDLISVIKRRYPNVNIIIAPVAVQGSGAADEIARAIEKLNKLTDIDVIIIGRGGGSIEELWAFNEEKVARAISKSKVPIISAVGHETDFTIADFVSDMRAPTPSAAGELVVPEKNLLINHLTQLKLRLLNAIYNDINDKKQRLEYLKKSSAFTRMDNFCLQHCQTLDRILRNMLDTIKLTINSKRQNFLSLVDKLNNLSPLEVMQRGYSICVRETDEKIIKSYTEVVLGEDIKILLHEGSLLCKVKDCYTRGNCGES